ncbi:MAG TPA: DUF5916 domain-containing protein [Vicinamibacterales bacterium]|nr:DUF5916 domain-containing protein [Vicinamibacterales bacterium]
MDVRTTARALTYLALVGVPAAHAQPVLVVPRVSEPPTLEDYLDGSPRPDEVAVTGFVQREPGDGVPVSQPTTAYLSYDDQHLYVIFVCRDREPERIRARMARREAILEDDAVGVLLDTFHDRRRAYLLASNPLGIQADAISAEGKDDDFSFDALWHSRGRLTADGYVVWMAIPFRSLRFPRSPEQTWGIALIRSIPRSNEFAFWPYMTRRIAGFTQQLATLQGIADVSPGRNIQFIPYAAFAGARFLREQPPAFETDRDGRAGLDAKVVLRDAFALDLALNPDFSQVESDEPQVTINQRFEVFFPEKRPFFIENAGYFQTPIALFFSRRIADPQLGVRLTGKRGGWSVGALAADDRAADEVARGRRAYVTVARLQRDVGRQSHVGLMATTRDVGDTTSRIVAVDTRWTLGRNWIAEAQAARSASRLSDGARDGHALTAALRRDGRHFEYSLSYEDFSPGFRAPLGFVRRVDVRMIEQFAEYTWRPEKGRLLSFGPQVFTLVNWARDGRVQDWQVSPEFGVELAGQTYAEISYDESYELFESLGFRKRSVTVLGGTSYLRWLEISGRLTRGTDVNFFPAPGLRPSLADAGSGRVSLTLRPTPPLRIDQTYLHSRLRTRAGPMIFENHILRTRVAYQFTRELSMRAILDYEGILPNASLVALEREKRFAADLLVTYLVNPWTAVYVGYTDRRENLRPDPIAGRLLRTDAPDVTTGRQVFAKVSYLLRF